MISTDHFNSMILTKLIKSEQAVNLKRAIIEITSPVCHPRPITVVTDSAPGFLSLTKSADKDLAALHIYLKLRDHFNKNYNAVINKSCQGIESEIRKMSPDGGKISPAVLAKATIAAKSR